MQPVKWTIWNGLVTFLQETNGLSVPWPGDKSDFILIFNQNGQLLEGVFASRITDKTRYCKAVYTYDSNGLAISKDLYGILWEGWHRPPLSTASLSFTTKMGGDCLKFITSDGAKQPVLKEKYETSLVFTGRVIYRYDDRQELKSKARYNSEGRLEVKWVYEPGARTKFNSQGRQTEPKEDSYPREAFSLLEFLKDLESEEPISFRTSIWLEGLTIPFNPLEEAQQNQKIEYEDSNMGNWIKRVLWIETNRFGQKS